MPRLAPVTMMTLPASGCMRRFLPICAGRLSAGGGAANGGPLLMILIGLTERRCAVAERRAAAADFADDQVARIVAVAGRMRGRRHLQAFRHQAPRLLRARRLPAR